MLKDTLVHPINAEDNAIALIKFESGAIGQFEVSWTFRGGMDLRDEVAGTHGTIWMNHFLRTGFEMFTAAEGNAYIAEKQNLQLAGYSQLGTRLQSLVTWTCSRICLIQWKAKRIQWKLSMTDMLLMQLWMPALSQRKFMAGFQLTLIGVVENRANPK